MERRPGKAEVYEPKQTEAQFQAGVLEYAGVRQWRWWHDRAVNQPKTCSRRVAGRRCGGLLLCVRCRQEFHPIRNAPGFLDLILLRPPRVIWAECKTEEGIVTPEQQIWLDDLAASGQEVYVWRPSDWYSILGILL